MSSLSPPIRNYNGASPPLRYGAAHPPQAWSTGYYHGPLAAPQSPQPVSMLYQVTVNPVITEVIVHDIIVYSHVVCYMYLL